MKSIDLQHGVVPISRAASSLAALIKRSRVNSLPIIITQKGYPSGVLLGIELYATLQSLADQQQKAGGESSSRSDAP
ncbi:type II toxin-antitoxin system Phd/YefM family antitoxin [Oscillochloris sp. ZM17-4]|uniref:type II toxin-antitoxin system Phd/YefM family antitoxin n=1 Tax=Oscillochloris sp. ZM17-4 TaxID=2866714 RepID=UPI001C7326C7|nr:type II toxin-antitoxin system Phd/YefM family antitoxin [Oscillochloris sp. ZM17-4]MBX0329600.1 type II toxin-antitoxin system Phd/YefM family antitoxin [Oscillochloris sp. ZM17-4]